MSVCFDSNSLTQTTGYLSHTWQLIVGLDATYARRNALSTSRQQLYLRRRNQLARWHLHKLIKQENVHTLADLRNEYLTTRTAVMKCKYGSPSPSPQQSLQVPSHQSFNSNQQLNSFNVLLERYQRESPSIQQTRSISGSSSFNSSSLRPVFDVHSKNMEENSVTTGYAFSGIETIFDHHKESITRIRFAHNDSTRLAVASVDNSVSICTISQISSTEENASVEVDPSDRVKWLNPPKECTGAIMDVAWSASNDFIVTASLDGSLCLWEVSSFTLARHFPSSDLNSGGILACEFHPGNNNYLAISDIKGVLQIVNLSTGRVVKDGRDQIHSVYQRTELLIACRTREDLSHKLGRGCITAIAFESGLGKHLWIGTDQGIIQSYFCNSATGKLVRARRLQLNPSPISETESFAHLTGRPLHFNKHKSFPAVLPKRKSSRWFSGSNKLTTKHNASSLSSFIPSITGLATRSWLSRSDSSTYLLVNAAGLGLLMYRVISLDGQLSLMQQFNVSHSPICSPPISNYGLHLLHSCFAPLISFRSGACAMSASEDGNVYVFEVLGCQTNNRTANSNCITFFQGHSGSVVDVSLSFDESVLASADESGNVIIWRREALLF